MINLESDALWIESLLAMVAYEINSCVKAKGSCNIMLTGGATARTLYSVWSSSGIFKKSLNNLNVYFTDERCVPPTSADSNYLMVANSLFKDGIPTGTAIYRMEAELGDPAGAAKEYSKVIPSAMDILLLSMANDGHVASIFPRSSVVREKNLSIVSVSSNDHPFNRLTITPKVIDSAIKVFVMAIGPDKLRLYNRALLVPDDIDEIPARLVIGKNWIFN